MTSIYSVVQFSENRELKKMVVSDDLDSAKEIVNFEII